MAFSITRALNIERKERGIVLLLLTQSIFLGIFAGSLDVGANSLFLESYSASLMPRAFMFSGIVGVAFTSLYAFLQKRLPFKLFTVLNMLVVVALTVLLRVGYAINSEDERLAFALLIMMGPLIIISMLGFWGTAGRYFTLREGKRLFGIIDTGAVVGMILAFYAIPVLVQFEFRVFDTLLIGLGGLVFAMLLQIITIQRYAFIPVVARSLGSGRKRSGLIRIFQKKYTRLMVFFVALSVITGFFIHYLFVTVTEFRYPDAKELTGFLGAFFGTMMVFTVIIKSTLYGWLMKNYGLRVAILVAPVMMLLLILVGAVVGGAFGYTAEATSFTFFFLVITLAKLFNKSLKDAIESPSMKILYQSLDSSERYDVQARIDGIVNELTAFITGLVMAGLIMLSFIQVIHFAYILIAILVMWIFMGVWLYTAYRTRLNDSITAVRRTTEKSATSSGDRELTETSMYNEIVRIDPFLPHRISDDELLAMLSSPDPEKQRPGWGLAVHRVLHIPDKQIDTIRSQAKDSLTLQHLDRYLRWQSLPSGNIGGAYRSGDRDERIAALYHTYRERDISHVPHIITMLRDRDMQIRSIAIEVAGHLKVRELCSYLVDYLGNDELYEVTLRAMVRMGELSLEFLDNAFYRSGISVAMQIRIIEALRLIGGARAHELLFNKVGYHQREIRRKVIQGLYDAGFRASNKQHSVLMDLLYETVHSGARHGAARYVIENNDPENGLLEALSGEKEYADQLIFMILGIAYDRQVIDHIRDSILDTEHDDSGYALELLNMIVEDEQFAYLEPYFDDLGVGEKIRRMQSEMPVVILEYEELLRELVSRDALYLGGYARVCALDAIRNQQEMTATQQLVAQVFHPNEAIRDTASAALLVKEPLVFDEIAQRLEDAYDDRPDRSFLAAYAEHPRHLMTTRSLSNWKMFEDIPHQVLFTFSRYLDPMEGDLPSLAGKAIIIRYGDAGIDNEILIVPEDHPELSDQIVYLAGEPGAEAYMVEVSSLRKLLFNEHELLKAIISKLNSSNIQTLLRQPTNPDKRSG